MPGGDGTGPNGTGGWCTPLWMSGQTQRLLGFGRRMNLRSPGMGGRGRGNMFRFNMSGVPGWASNYNELPQSFGQIKPTKEQELNNLEQQKNLLEQEKESIDNELNDLKKKIKDFK